MGATMTMTMSSYYCVGFPKIPPSAALGRILVAQKPYPAAVARNRTVVRRGVLHRIAENYIFHAVHVAGRAGRSREAHANGPLCAAERVLDAFDPCDKSMLVV